MPLIQYEASDFGSHWGTQLAGRHDLSISWQELVWAAITVGKPGIAHLLTHGWHSISDVIVRSHTVYANLRQGSNRFQKSTLYQDLDPTEKGAASYFMGMVAAKVLCARLLDTPWLLHLSMFQAAGGAAALRGRSQPDLIGIDRMGRWTVAEAKGRSNAFSADAMSKAKQQTRRLRRINGSLPNVRVAVQAHFSPNLCFSISDPEDMDEEPIDVSLNEDAAIRQYYSFPLEATRSPARRENRRGREYDLAKIDEVGVTIGLSSELRQFLEGDNQMTFAAVRDRSQPASNQIETDSAPFADGLLIELDERWSEERMAYDPDKRKDG
ncbi:hypothetical protein [Elongatibacter sediminis]|uniref:Uncharacterized protein n=1 Tax=Elongatibacter sediminis TaxID=3119006 RepID=A0AAW9RMF3_9GAMM